MTPETGNFREVNEPDIGSFMSKSRKGTDISFGRASNLFFTNPEERISEEN